MAYWIWDTEKKAVRITLSFPTMPRKFMLRAFLFPESQRSFCYRILLLLELDE